MSAVLSLPEQEFVENLVASHEEQFLRLSRHVKQCQVTITAFVDYVVHLDGEFKVRLFSSYEEWARLGLEQLRRELILAWFLYRGQSTRATTYRVQLPVSDPAHCQLQRKLQFRQTLGQLFAPAVVEQVLALPLPLVTPPLEEDTCL